MRRVIDQLSAYLLPARIEGDNFGRPAAWFREQDEAPVNFRNPERRPRGIGELDTAHRASSDSEQWDVALRVSVLHCPGTEHMKWRVAEFGCAFEAHADAGIAEVEAEAARGANVCKELVPAS